ncbi:MAG: hypothetical protein KYX66_11790 [Blastomonas fulva]|uniref:hypothetical protein n=1 Tax=Blastomonas fulva TaxID=1550728 RepID=UPI0024E1FAF5|nr:hypothetical protein [Blastomonas fulva]MDK2757411.1 hypothetical protein [Blastomonas fulva]
MIDRRVKILAKDGSEPAVRRMSELRDRPFVVLLGEPGIGKSTVLEVEAAADGVATVPVRAAIGGVVPLAGTALYLDGLDEYRADGNEADKMWQVAKLLRDLAPPRWRLTCRAEDWRSDADRKVLANAGAVTVAQLLALSLEESAEVLSRLGELDPAAFIADARRVGAGGLLESPLSLRLLRAAISNKGAWPTTRFDLFAEATRQFTFEHNEDHQARRDRSRADEIAATADRFALTLLTTGSRSIWRSPAAPPSGTVPSDVFGIPTAVIADTLDTPLFTGPENEFELMHRSVAEFLAARELAAAVAGNDERAALPLGRALALLSGANGRVPSELRGVQAWLAAHLAKRGDAVRTSEVIDRDPIGALAYGDPAVFDHPTAMRLFESLDEKDPYFLGSTTIDGSTVLGGLAREDMATTFLSALNAPAYTHKLSLVFSILEHGRILPTVHPRLWDLATDPSRDEWQRSRAADAWLAGEPDPAHARRALFNALASETPSVARETLRSKLLAAAPPGTLGISDIKDVIAAFIATDRDDVVMRLYPLQRRLVAEPMPGLFADPLKTWLPDENNRRQSLELDSLIDAALAAAIQADDGADAGRLWRWTANARDDIWEPLGKKAGKAMIDWLGAGPDRAAKLFEAILADAAPDDGPWTFGHSFATLAGQFPGAAVRDHVRDRAEAAADPGAREWLAKVLVELARNKATPPSEYYAIFLWVETHQPALLERLASSELDETHQKRQASKKELAGKRNAAHQKLVHALAPQLEALSAGAAVAALDELARFYLQIDGANGLTGEKRLIEETTRDIGEAALAGFDALALAEPPLTPEEIGRLEADGSSHYAELPILAGIVRMLAGHEQ